MARPRLITDEAILEATRRCLLEEGANVSTTRIAETVGISQATLFQRFGTKEKLLIAAVTPGELHHQLFELYVGGPDERSLHIQLCEIGRALAALFEDRFPLFEALQSVGITHDQMFAGMDTPPPVKGHRALVAWLDRAQAAGRLTGVDTSVFAAAFGGAIHGRSFMDRLSGEAMLTHSLEDFLDSLVRLLLPGGARGEDHDG